MGVLLFKQIFFRSFVVFHGTFLLFPACWTLNYTASPLFQNTPFVWVSNAPTEVCAQRHKVNIDMSLFTLSGSPWKQVTEQEITLFYTDKLGYYPFITSTGDNINGGLPQLGCLYNHLHKAKSDIRYNIGSNRVGLAVIDWPEWNPLWDRTWITKHFYMDRSIHLVRLRDKLDVNDATAKAKVEYENAGKDFMKETLKLGKLLRPKYLWGFFQFPDCYNADYHRYFYNGSCAFVEVKRNNDLQWLWEESTALYPSLYIPTLVSISEKTTIYIRNRVQEAIRISKVRNVSDPVPVFVYFLPVYTDATNKYLSMADLVATVGETISLGATGLVMWGSFNSFFEKSACNELNHFMKTKLNPYIINVTLASKMCSQVLCHEEGVCLRKNWNSNDYLHLNPKNFAIQFVRHGKYTIVGQPTLDDLQELFQKFDCVCYANVNCKMRTNVDNVDTVHVCFPEDVCIDASLKSVP